MAQEVRVLLWCDHHRLNLGEDTEGTKQTVTINGVSYETEMCPECITELLDPLRAVLEESGRRVSRSRRAVSSDSEGLLSPTHDRDKAVNCPVPDCGKEVLVASLGSHCRNMHGKSLYEVQEETGVWLVVARRPSEKVQATKKSASRRRR